MMHEFKELRQYPQDGFRRLFQDDYFELYIWYDKPEGVIIGFQLVYNKKDDPHALTWHKGKGYMHNLVDDGENAPGGPKKTPVLVPDGMFNTTFISRKFDAASLELEQPIRKLVLEMLGEYSPNLLQPDL